MKNVTTTKSVNPLHANLEEKTESQVLERGTELQPWTTCILRRRRIHVGSSSHLDKAKCPQIATSNKYHILSENKEQYTQSKNTLGKTKTNFKRNNKRQTISNRHVPERVKVELYADSQGRGLPEIVGSCSKGKVYMDGLVKPGADINYIYNQANRAQLRPIILLAGTNNALNGSLQDVFQQMEHRLLVLSESRPVCITTIPPRYDINLNDAIHYDIAVANNYIRELVSRINNVELIDLEHYGRHCFTQHGMHLNYKGKKNLALQIISFIENVMVKQLKPVFSKEDIPTFRNSQIHTYDNANNHKTIKILNTNMEDIIKHYKHSKKVGFAHSISADFHDKRHMTAGVAVIFRKMFGKPNTAHCITKHLALQDGPQGASVYSLITKTRYFNKPTIQDYDAAFCDLASNFRSRGLKHLICSPIGCVRDRIDLSHFISNILKFQRETKARITIVSYPEESYRSLRNGIPHEDFWVKLNNLVFENTRSLSSSVICSDSTTDETDTAQVNMEMGCLTPLDVTPLADDPPTVPALKTSAEVTVIPGDLTFCEALKQSMSDCVLSASPVTINVNNSQENCTTIMEDSLVNSTSSLRSDFVKSRLGGFCNNSDEGSQEGYTRTQYSFLVVGKERLNKI